MKKCILSIILFFLPFTSYGDQNSAITIASKYVKKINPEMSSCVSYQVYQEDNDFYYIKVRTENRNKSCTGDPNISVTLFNLKVSKSSNKLYKVDELGINGDQLIPLDADVVFSKYCHDINADKEYDGTLKFRCDFQNMSISESYEQLLIFGYRGLKHALPLKNSSYKLSEHTLSYKWIDKSNLEIKVNNDMENIIYTLKYTKDGTLLSSTYKTGY